MRRVGTKDATTVSAQQLDGLLRSDGCAGDIHAEGGHHVRAKSLHCAQEDEHKRNDKGKGKQNSNESASEVNPEVTNQPLRYGSARDTRLTSTNPGIPRVAKVSEPADESHRHTQADGCGSEVLYGKAQHLGTVCQGVFSRIGLPVGVGHERCRRIESHVGLDSLVSGVTPTR